MTYRPMVSLLCVCFTLSVLLPAGAAEVTPAGAPAAAVAKSRPGGESGFVGAVVVKIPESIRRAAFGWAPASGPLADAAKFHKAEFLRRIGVDPEKDIDEAGLVLLRLPEPEHSSPEFLFYLNGRFDTARIAKAVEELTEGGLQIKTLGGQPALLKEGNLVGFAGTNQILGGPEAAVEPLLTSSKGTSALFSESDRKRLAEASLGVILHLSHPKIQEGLGQLAEKIQHPAAKSITGATEIGFTITGPEALLTVTLGSPEGAKGIADLVIHVLDVQRRRLLDKRQKSEEEIRKSSVHDYFLGRDGTKYMGEALLAQLIEDVGIAARGGVVEARYQIPKEFESGASPMIAIAGIGIAAAIAVPNFKRAQGDAQKRTCHSHMKTIGGATELYAMENPPTPGKALTVGELVEKKYLRNAPKCPLGKGADYTIRTGGSEKTPTLDVVCPGPHGSLEDLDRR